VLSVSAYGFDDCLALQVVTGLKDKVTRPVRVYNEEGSRFRTRLFYRFQAFAT